MFPQQNICGTLVDSLEFPEIGRKEFVGTCILVNRRNSLDSRMIQHWFNNVVSSLSQRLNIESMLIQGCFNNVLPKMFLLINMRVISVCIYEYVNISLCNRLQISFCCIRFKLFLYEKFLLNQIRFAANVVCMPEILSADYPKTMFNLTKKIYNALKSKSHIHL